jgi:hypothetical protein
MYSEIIIQVLILTCLSTPFFFYIKSKSVNRITALVISPFLFILINLILIFVLRPWLIIYHNADTIDNQLVNLDDWNYIFALSIFSMVSIFFAFKITRSKVFGEGKYNLLHVNNSVLSLYYILNIVLVGSIYFFGTALSNGLDRIENISNYKFYFIFIFIYKIHYVCTILIYAADTIKNNNKITSIVLFIIISPILQILVSGRGSGLFMLVSLFIIYVIKGCRSYNFYSSLKVLAFFIMLFLLNYILASVRIMLQSENWQQINYFSLFNINEVTSTDLIELIKLASWDYSLFDTCVTIVNAADGFKYGWTNVSYLSGYIPRLFWPEKPFDQGYMLGLTNKFYSDIFDQTGSTFSGSLVCEGYWNFGIFGVLFYSFIFGYFVFFHYFMAISKKDAYSIALYAIIMPMTFQIYRGGLDTIVQFYLMTYFPIKLISILMKRNVKHDLR